MIASPITPFAGKVLLGTSTGDDYTFSTHQVSAMRRPVGEAEGYSDARTALRELGKATTGPDIGAALVLKVEGRYYGVGAMSERQLDDHEMPVPERLKIEGVGLRLQGRFTEFSADEHLYAVVDGATKVRIPR